MTAIEEFLSQKRLSVNSRQAYAYDLEQFRQVVAGEIDNTQLQAYQLFISSFKPSVQKRKLSAVNQFLAYLYEKGQLKTFHRLKGRARPIPANSDNKPAQSLLDLSLVEGDCQAKVGQVIALLIVHLGLQPNEINHLKVAAIDLPFGIVTVQRQEQIRVLRLPELLVPYLEPHLKGIYLFGRGEKTYSRQWLFKELRNFLLERGWPDLSAQKLREQYILHQLKAGLSLSTIAQNLGLKGVTTLERYQHAGL